MTNFNERELRDALGTFATGITVITTTNAKKEPVGITANSFTSVSLEPPLILWCLGNETECYEDFVKCRSFAVHVLHAEQEEISRQFATRSDDKFAGLEWEFSEGGLPILKDCSTCLQCETEVHYPGGDHVIIVGRVKSIMAPENCQPLIYYNGNYSSLNCK